MEFAKYYNVSNLVEDMQKAEEVDGYPTGDDKFEGVYVCMDTNDFWISRINKGYNEEYEREDEKYLVDATKSASMMSWINFMNYILRNCLTLRKMIYNLK